MWLGEWGMWLFLVRRNGYALHGGIRSFQLGQDFLCPSNNLWRKSRQFGNMNTIATVCAAWNNFTHEDHVAIPFLDRHAIVFDPFTSHFKLRHLVIVSGKQRPGS